MRSLEMLTVEDYEKIRKAVLVGRENRKGSQVDGVSRIEKGTTV